jgi:riboflavin transporter FmnP
MKKSGMNAKVIRMAQLAMLAAVSVVLVAFVSFPLIPVAPFLKYDMADVPILLAALLFGTAPGLIVLFLVSAIQAFLFGGDGWVGMVMHFVASGAMVILAGEFYKRRKQFKDLVLGLVLGVLAMTAVMIPMNLFLTTFFLGRSSEAVVQMLLPAIIPFNLLKAGLNSLLTAILFKALQPFVKKHGEMFRAV